MQLIPEALGSLILRAWQVIDVPRLRIPQTRGKTEKTRAPAPADIVRHGENAGRQCAVHHERPVGVVAVLADETSAEIVDKAFRAALERRERGEARRRSGGENQARLRGEAPAFGQ